MYRVQGKEKENSLLFKSFPGVAVTVTGASGFIGRHLVERLVALGSKPELITRNPRRVSELWGNKVSVIQGDLRQPGDIITKETDLVFHLAGEIREPAQFWKTNVEGTARLLDLCLQRGVKKFIYLSSVGVMGIERPGVVDETGPCTPRNDYERSKLEAERLVLEAHTKHGLEVVILRPSIVYGSGKSQERDSFLSLIRSIHKGSFRHIGSDKSIYNIVYVGDVVEALLHLALNNTGARNNIFIINDSLEWGDFVEAVQAVLGQERKVSAIPQALALSLAFACEGAKLVGVKLPFSLSRYKALTSRTIFSSERIKRELGFRFAFGNREGLKMTLGYYQKNNLL